IASLARGRATNWHAARRAGPPGARSMTRTSDATSLTPSGTSAEMGAYAPPTEEHHVMSIAIHQLTPIFAGEVSGVDITQKLSKDEVAAIEAGMDRCAVLVFHDQKLTDPQQQVFSRNFGELEHTAGANITKAQDRRLDPY